MRYLTLPLVLLALLFPQHVTAAEVPLQERVLAAMLKLSPPERHRPPPGWAETPEAARARYAAIAEDIAVVSTSKEDAATLLGIGKHESAWYADVDANACYRGPGWEKRCDSGRAWSVWQLQGGGVEKMTRREAAAETLRRAKRSRNACAKNAPSERLAAYTAGTCSSLIGKAVARDLDASVQRALGAL